MCNWFQGTEGIFHLRGRLLALLRSQPGAVVYPADVEPGARPLAEALQEKAEACSAFVERVQSQVDVSVVVKEELTPAAARVLNDVLSVDIQKLVEDVPELAGRVVDELLDQSVGGDGFTGPALAYAPLHMLMAVRGARERSSASDAPVFAPGACDCFVFFFDLLNIHIVPFWFLPPGVASLLSRRLVGDCGAGA